MDKLHPGHLVWYHQEEPVEGIILKAPWRFVTVGFLAPDLPPPPDERRVIPVPAPVKRSLRSLLLAWREGPEDCAMRALLCIGLLNQALRDVLALTYPAPTAGPALATLPSRWWKAEKWARQNLEQPPALAELARRAGLSERGTSRACHAATGMSPGRRLKAIRLAHARNLLQLTDLRITEVAQMAGYGRVQEFSRDMRKHHGINPTTLRARGPDYHELEAPAPL